MPQTPRQRTSTEPAPVPRLPAHVRKAVHRNCPAEQLTPAAHAALAAAYAAGLRDGADVRNGATELLTPAQVRALLPVDRKTLTRWADKGELRTSRTAGGHRRFLREDVAALIKAKGWTGKAQPPGSRRS